MARARWRRRLLQPARPQVPHARAWKIGFRTIHLMSTGILLGAHAVGAPPDPLRPVLWTAIISGAALIALEAGATLHWVAEGWGVLVVVKLALLSAMPALWAARLPILLVVVALGSIGSHMPGRLRHYSFIYHRVIKE